MARRKPVTLADISAELGLSRSTVSRALSNPGRVGADVGARVRAAADRLGYRRDPVHSAPSLEPRGVLAVLVVEATSVFYFDVLRGVEDEAFRSGYATIVLDGRANPTMESWALHRVSPMVDGFILISPRMPDRAILQFAKVRPTVVLNRTTRGVASVVQRATEGLSAAVDHLVNLGHREVTYLGGPAAARIEGDRRRALESASARAGLKLVRTLDSGGNLQKAMNAGAEWAARPTSSVICYNDEAGVGFVYFAKKAGYRVPEDVSVIGMGGHPVGSIIEPTLTTIRFDGWAQGRTAVRTVLGEGRSVTTIAMALEVRDSTGPAPSAT